jgi:predicted DNA-binding transcriptional regulator YafY
MKRNMICRLNDLAQILNRNSYPSVKIIAKELEVSERTIKRDLEILRTDYVAPIEYDHQQKGFFLCEKWEFSLPELSEGEVLALLIATSILKQFKGTPLEASLKSLESKVEEIFRGRISFSSQDMNMFISTNISPINMKLDIKDVFEKIFGAITQKKQIQIEYTTMETGEIKSRIINPYHIYHSQGVWYFCGFCHLREEVRDFALDRIRKCKVLTKIFQADDNFDLNRYFEKAFRMMKGNPETIRIKFDALQSRWIRERIWHPSQKIIELPNEELIMELHADAYDIKRWILSYGLHAEIIQPLWLRKEILKELKEQLKQYEKYNLE